LLALLAASPVAAADAVVEPPCDEAAFDAALSTVQGSGGGTVTFNCGAAVIPITVWKVILALANVTLDGGGLITLSGGNASPLFYVDEAGRLMLEGLTLSEAYNADFDGGAIYNLGTLVVANSTFRNNRTTAAFSGGAIASYGPVEIIDSLFEGNQGGGGGALYLRFAASASIRNTIFRNNATLSATSGWGGAILTWDGPTATIEGGEMYENRATSGGAIFNTANSSLVITGTSIHHNQALNGDGGGIYSAGSLTMTAGVVHANSCREGGGLYLTGTSAQVGTARLTGTSVRGNSCSGSGGGLANLGASLSMHGGSLQANSSGGYGGGLYFGFGDTSLARLTVSHNAAREGGGIAALLGASLDVSDSTLDGNRATFGMGGALLMYGGQTSLRNSTLSGNTAVRSGGGVWKSGVLQLENVTLSGNAAPQGGGLVDVAGVAVTLKNTILANSPQGGNCDGPIGSSKYSISSDNTCALVGPGDRNATDPMLMPLGAYGGPTLVHMLAPGSPAIDGVFGNDAPATDQRGTPRPQGLGFDVGAVERTPTDPDEPPDLIFADGFEEEP
jgi:hypothetical protein